ncbi:MAG: fluoride efflux transporter CrcB [Acidiphilium sp.]|jgi:CrcB protein
MRTLLAIALFGTLGCWARYGQTILVQNLAGRAFPVAVLSINVMGSFLIGLLFFASLERFSIGPALRIGILTGFLGGYTTFSTFELETLLLIENGQWLRAGLYLFSSVGLGLIAVLAGAALARSL